MKETMYRIFSTIFNISLPLFMLMGFAVVAIQLIGALLGLGQLVLMAGDCELYCIWMSVVCGFAGFIAHYFKPKKSNQKKS
jgi:hypothetical protein